MGDAHDIVIVGGGGHASVLLDALRLAATVNVLGYIAPQESLLSTFGVPWLGDDARRSALAARGVKGAVLGIAGVKSNLRRSEIFAMWSAEGFVFADVVHPRSVVSPHVRHGTGLQVLAGAVINPGARLGVNVIVNTNATVEHDCEIGDHAHVAPGATLCGGVVVREGALIGAGAVAAPGIHIGRFALVGAGSTVARDVADEGVVMGRPAMATGIAKGLHS